MWKLGKNLLHNNKFIIGSFEDFQQQKMCSYGLVSDWFGLKFNGTHEFKSMQNISRLFSDSFGSSARIEKDWNVGLGFFR